MSEKERMLAGRLYLAFDEELGRDNKKARTLTRLFNSSTEEQQDYRKILLKQLFKSTGDNIYIEPPFRTDYGCNTSIGENFYANYDCIIIYVCSVTIGEMFSLPQGSPSIPRPIRLTPLFVVLFWNLESQSLLEMTFGWGETLSLILA